MPCCIIGQLSEIFESLFPSLGIVYNSSFVHVDAFLARRQSFSAFISLDYHCTNYDYIIDEKEAVLWLKDTICLR